MMAENESQAPQGRAEMEDAVPPELRAIEERWRSAFPAALELWSRFTKLSEPRWCATREDEKREGLHGSFAMIRLQDHGIVISLRQIAERGLESRALEILAHEIGHHVFTPGDLRDNARLLARVRVGLATREHQAGMVANLYSDLLINDRLQRSAGLDMAGVYRTLAVKGVNRLWSLYLRIYEVLWSLPTGTLAGGPIDAGMDTDAGLGARLVRVYGKHWLDGAGRFAALCLPYLLETPDPKTVVLLPPWLDTLGAGGGTVIPDGLAEMDEDELDGAIHPAEDEELTGLRPRDRPEPAPGDGADGRNLVGGRKNPYRSPSDYVDLMKSAGVTVEESDLVIRYYRERALRHLIPFPSRELPQASDPLPEGLDIWDAGEPLHEVDWLQSLVQSPVIIPGLTTVKRHHGTSPGGQPERRPVNLYLGVDCSGSMINPRFNLSYPVLAGSVIVLSALRAGARVMATLSGEPGQHASTPGFIRSEREVLKILTGYLGTGYAFGILRLEETFLAGEPAPGPVHILVVTDSDIFYMLDQVASGWDIARRAAEAAGGGATFVLHLPARWAKADAVRRLEDCGWQVYLVEDLADLVAFARAFSRRTYQADVRELQP